jgi:alpha-tubulin suppressor-like RCC1 family protein
MSTVSVGRCHALALSEDGQVYSWCESRGLLGNQNSRRRLLPKPVQALRGVRVGSVAAAGFQSYAVADTGELWAWGRESRHSEDAPLGHGKQANCPLPKPIESLQGIMVDAVAAGCYHTLALGDNGGVYAWGTSTSGWFGGSLGLGATASAAGSVMHTPERLQGIGVTGKTDVRLRL